MHQLNSPSSHLQSGLQSHEFTNMPTDVSARTHMHSDSHPLPWGIFSYVSFVLLSLLSVKDILTSAVLDSGIPELNFISANYKESRSDSTKTLYMTVSETTVAIKASIKDSCTHLDGCQSHTKLYTAL